MNLIPQAHHKMPSLNLLLGIRLLLVSIFSCCLGMSTFDSRKVWPIHFDFIPISDDLISCIFQYCQYCHRQLFTGTYILFHHQIWLPSFEPLLKFFYQFSGTKKSLPIWQVSYQLVRWPWRTSVIPTQTSLLIQSTDQPSGPIPLRINLVM